MKIPGYFKRSSFVAFAAAAFALAGCTSVEEDIFRDGPRPTDRLAFSAALERRNAGVTRSSVACLEIAEENWEVQTMSESRNVTRAPIANHLSGEAGVIGFQYDNPDGSRIPIAEDDNNIGFTFHGDQLTSTNTTILWKTITKANLNIYAYVPKATEGLTVTSATAPPALNYTVPDDIAQQTDLLVARWKSIEQTDPNYKNQTIHLAFDHALTAICFKVGFDCTVKSVAINNVYNKGTYNLEDGVWTVDDTSEASYNFLTDEEGVHFDSGNEVVDRSDCFILMPQTLPAGAEIVLTVDEAGTEKTYTAPIGGKVWEPGKLITYTLHKDKAPATIYFDLAAGMVSIGDEVAGGGKLNYKGFVFKKNDNDEWMREEVSGEHKDGNHYYVYQSSFPSGTGEDQLPGFDNRASIWSDDGKVCTPPVYEEVKGPDGRPWSEFITNNTDVDAVIEAWYVKNNDLVTKVNRRGTNNWISITGAVTCELTIDNIYSVYQDKTTQRRRTAGITFVPIRNESVRDAKVTIKMIGDNRVGAVHYSNWPANNGNQIIFEGTGSLTVADVDGVMVDGNSSLNDLVGIETGKRGYWSNHFCSAIGGNDWPGYHEEEAYGIVINSGTIFAGTTKAENCTAIGGGGNEDGEVIINGGTVTAVATTTGTAIGGGIGYGDPGGPGFVTITGGNVYAYNHANKWSIPSSAIGGAGSRSSTGASGKVTIEGGYVYAYSAGGTAIGGGSSYTLRGGDADITIKGGEVFAKTGSEESSSIGGGTACSGTPANAYDGGSATITIFGNPIIRTGSIGGGGKGVGKGYIGSAHIQISGNADIQAQFILSAGTKEGNVPTFHMAGGMIRNSDTADEEYLHVKEDGGAVYLENGTVTIDGGTIQNCSAKHGGAIYIAGSQGSDSNAKFEMTGGTIQGNESSSDGGAIYIIDGTADLSGGNIYDNLAAGGNGGGIFMQRGALTVDGATIQNNSSEIRRSDDGSTYIGGNGGGIYVFSLLQDVTVDLLSGIIADNTADRKGGGVCVDMQNSSNSANVTIGTVGGSDDGIRIMYNHSLQQGGGLYARGSKADITINSGTIMDNTVSQYVYNQNVANEQGAVTLNGGNVTHNVVKFYANYGDDTAPVHIQNIVTSTNSTLVAPALTRQGYRLEGWNTKPSGKGENYSDGQLMNINEDITLYAQWAIDV